MRRLLICLTLVAGLGLVGVAPAQAASACADGYSPCLPVKKDLNCPEVLKLTDDQPVTVTGEDQYDLDRDNDGLGCEPSGVDGPGRPTPTPTKASPTASTQSPTPAATSDDDEDPALPVTGSSALTAALVALGLLLFGAAIVAVARRRRPVQFRA